MTTDDTYFERGINLRHGYLAEYFADRADFRVKVPTGLRTVGVLMEPMSVAEKAIRQAHPVSGLANYAQLIETLTSGRDVIKAFCEVAPLA
jgi:threonine dehydrogenase-like Zn-dependent dehydrogenase